ncbi:hypothetical protein [Vibrio tasmaniensis]
MASLKRKYRLQQDLEHQQVKYLNNGLQSNHFLLKSY